MHIKWYPDVKASFSYWDNDNAALRQWLWSFSNFNINQFDISEPGLHYLLQSIVMRRHAHKQNVSDCLSNPYPTPIH